MEKLVEKLSEFTPERFAMHNRELLDVAMFLNGDEAMREVTVNALHFLAQCDYYISWAKEELENYINFQKEETEILIEKELKKKAEEIEHLTEIVALQKYLINQLQNKMKPKGEKPEVPEKI